MLAAAPEQSCFPLAVRNSVYDISMCRCDPAGQNARAPKSADGFSFSRQSIVRESLYWRVKVQFCYIEDLRLRGTSFQKW